ncbi:hypothetical protein SBV1_800010 [Verrucomicrobia bacterium]|nr:hypothetical protein SBV1_800010 [Verrucomicrobiota bacterium]
MPDPPSKALKFKHMRWEEPGSSVWDVRHLQDLAKELRSVVFFPPNRRPLGCLISVGHA